MKFIFKAHKVIKIPNKGFDDLSAKEVGLMIEADSSISPGGNDFFASCALDEFLHNAELIRPDLKKIQNEILENIYIDVHGTINKKINTEFLKEMARKLKSEKG